MDDVHYFSYCFVFPSSSLFLSLLDCILVFSICQFFCLALSCSVNYFVFSLSMTTSLLGIVFPCLFCVNNFSVYIWKYRVQSLNLALLLVLFLISNIRIKQIKIQKYTMLGYSVLAGYLDSKSYELSTT